MPLARWRAGCEASAIWIRVTRPHPASQPSRPLLSVHHSAHLHVLGGQLPEPAWAPPKGE
eukprot:scaffold2234_cov134-Prasinococcus_capsulatus_cf.AAC.1